MLTARAIAMSSRAHALGAHALTWALCNFQREDVSDAAQRMISTIRNRLAASRTPSEGSVASADDLGSSRTGSPVPSHDKLEFV